MTSATLTAPAPDLTSGEVATAAAPPSWVSSSLRAHQHVVAALVAGPDGPGEVLLPVQRVVAASVRHRASRGQARARVLGAGGHTGVLEVALAEAAGTGEVHAEVRQPIPAELDPSTPAAALAAARGALAVALGGSAPAPSSVWRVRTGAGEQVLSGVRLLALTASPSAGQVFAPAGVSEVGPAPSGASVSAWLEWLAAARGEVAGEVGAWAARESGAALVGASAQHPQAVLLVAAGADVGALVRRARAALGPDWKLGLTHTTG